MKILITSPLAIWPASFGGAVRTISIARAFEAMGVGVTVLSANPVGPPEEIGASAQWIGYKFHGRASHFINIDFLKEYVRALENSPDLILSGFPYQAPMLVMPAKHRRIPIVYDAHNVEADRFRRLGHPVLAIAIRWLESFLCRNARAILAVSNNDQHLFRIYYNCKSILLPNGVETDRFAPGEPDDSLLARYDIRGRKVVLFFGPLDYAPNLDALSYLIHQAWPLISHRQPDARLLVVGRCPPSWAEGVPGVIVTRVVDDIVAHIRLANVVVVPLSKGGGTRLKILEALSCGQTVLSTPFGAKGIPCDDEPSLILADLKDFASRLATILVDPAKPCTNKVSRQIALQFNWKKLVNKVDWESLVSGRRRGL